MRPKAVLKELFDLLESYAPSWYTEEHHKRVATALHHPIKPGPRLVKPAQPTQAPRAGSERDSTKPGNGTYIQ